MKTTTRIAAILLYAATCTSCTAYDELPQFVPGAFEKKIKKMPNKPPLPEEIKLAV